MKIAAIALASALVSVASAQASFAQNGNFNDRDQSRPAQYGPGAQNQFRGGMDRGQDTFGQRDNWRQDRNWRGADNEGWRGGWHHDAMAMEGRGGPMGRMRDRFADERGASFSFGNGRARMSVHCPANEPVETCVRAASQLLDKITTLRGSNSAEAASGSNTGSGLGDSGRAGSPSNGGSGSSGSGSVQHDQE
jgi:hypothetical protein